MARADELYPAEVYHGSTHDINEFDATNANPESDWGPATYTSTSMDDINPNYAGEGPDLTQRIQIQAERIADDMGLDYDDPEVIAAARKQVKGGNEGVVYPLRMNTEKYANIGGDNPTYIEMPDYHAQAADDIDRADYADDWEYEDAVSERVWELEADDYDHPLVAIADRIKRMSAEEDMADAAIMEIRERGADGLTATDIDEIIRSNNLYGEGDNGEIIPAGGISAKVLEDLGFEGVIDNTVDAKFGSSRRLGQHMEGVYPDTQHVVTFPGYEKNIRSINAKFDPKKKNSANILAGGAAAALGLNALYDRDEYVTK